MLKASSQLTYHSVAIAQEEIRCCETRQAEKRTTPLPTLCSTVGRWGWHSSPGRSQLLIQDLHYSHTHSPFPFSHFLRFTVLWNSLSLLVHKALTHLPPALLSRKTRQCRSSKQNKNDTEAQMEVTLQGMTRFTQASCQQCGPSFQSALPSTP